MPALSVKDLERGSVIRIDWPYGGTTVRVVLAVIPIGGTLNAMTAKLVRTETTDELREELIHDGLSYSDSDLRNAEAGGALIIMMPGAVYEFPKGVA